MKQNISDVLTNISKGAKSVGTNITTEVAKEVAENIGKKLEDLRFSKVNSSIFTF